MDNVILAFAAQLSPHSDSRNTGSSISTVLMMIMAIIIALNIFDVISSWLYRAMVSISLIKALANGITMSNPADLFATSLYWRRIFKSARSSDLAISLKSVSMLRRVFKPSLSTSSPLIGKLKKRPTFQGYLQ